MPLKKNKISKISILVLVLMLLFLSVKYYKVSEDFNDFVKNSELDNKVLECQLSEILHKYDSISAKDQIDTMRFDDENKLDESVNEVKDKSILNSFEDSIVYYAKEQQKAKKEANKTIIPKIVAKENIVSKSVRLSAINVNAKGVKIYSDNYNLNEAKIQQLRVCFTLGENELVKSGTKVIYVQVINPKNQIISAGNTFIESEDNTKLQYSASVNTNYQRKDTDVCTYVNLEQNKTIKGKYKINIYHDFVKIGTTIFEY